MKNSTSGDVLEKSRIISPTMVPPISSEVDSSAGDGRRCFDSKQVLPFSPRFARSMVSLGFRGVFAVVLGLVLLGSSEAVDSWRTVFSTWFPDGATRGELHGKLVLDNQQTLQIPDTYLTLALGAPPRIFGEAASGKWSFSGRLAFGARDDSDYWCFRSIGCVHGGAAESFDSGSRNSVS